MTLTPTEYRRAVELYVQAGGVLEVVDALDVAELGDLVGGQPDAGGARDV